VTAEHCITAAVGAPAETVWGLCLTGIGIPGIADQEIIPISLVPPGSRVDSRCVTGLAMRQTRIAADLSGRRLGADQDQGGADLGNVCASGACGWSRPRQPKLALLCRVAFGQRDRYQATVCCTASRCAVGSRRPKAASNLLASTTKGARNW
jgi:hypothetical protein